LSLWAVIRQLVYARKIRTLFCAGLLTRYESCGMFTTHGVADAELRWIHPRGIPRPEQRGADSPGRLVALIFAAQLRAGAEVAQSEEMP